MELDKKPPHQDEKYLAAQKRVQEIKSFYHSLVAFILINILLVIINLLTDKNLWFYWITLVWGIVLISQAFKVFFFKGKFLGKQWEERKIKEILEEDNPSSDKNTTSKD